MEWLILLAVVVVGVVVVVLTALGERSAASRGFPYDLNEPLFTPAERSFYGILRQAVGEEAVVFGKVRIADVLVPSTGLGRSNWQKAFNRISSKHFDYVICSPHTLRVLSVIELDDKSHAKRKRVERDRLIEGACSSAGLTLHRFKASVAYNIGDVRLVLFPPPEEALPGEVSFAGDSPPTDRIQLLCPKCSSPLERKVAKKGKQKGKEFLACSAFPKCRYIEKDNT